MRKTIFTTLLCFAACTCIAQSKIFTAPLIKKVSAKELRTILDTTSMPLIVNFWATWCGPCIREIPWFDSIMAKKNYRVKLLLVNLNYSNAYPNQLTAFIKEHGYKGEVVFLDETNPNYFIPAIEKKWKGEIPASVFINNPKKYYEVFNQQLPPKRFELELEKLINAH